MNTKLPPMQLNYFSYLSITYKEQFVDRDLFTIASNIFIIIPER